MTKLIWITGILAMTMQNQAISECNKLDNEISYCLRVAEENQLNLREDPFPLSNHAKVICNGLPDISVNKFIADRQRYISKVAPEPLDEDFKICENLYASSVNETLLSLSKNAEWVSLVRSKPSVYGTSSMNKHCKNLSYDLIRAASLDGMARDCDSYMAESETKAGE